MGTLKRARLFAAPLVTFMRAALAGSRRALRGAAAHFRLRFVEWEHATFLFGLGMVLRHSAASTAGPQWAEMLTFASREQWGLIFEVVGGVRAAALLVNGSFRRFPWSPHIRVAVAAASLAAWFLLAIGQLSTGLITAGLPFFGGLFLGEFVYARWIIHDIGDPRRGDAAHGAS